MMMFSLHPKDDSLADTYDNVFDWTNEYSIDDNFDEINDNRYLEDLDLTPQHFSTS